MRMGSFRIKTMPLNGFDNKKRLYVALKDSQTLEDGSVILTSDCVTQENFDTNVDMLISNLENLKKQSKRYFK